MLYQFLRPIVTIAVHIFYKRIVIVNRDRLNQAGPTLLISNHNNAFLDAVVVAMFTKHKIYSVARGDVFNSSLMSWILTKLCIIPIFRKEEGAAEMHKNEASFEKCMQLLEAGQTVLMYPEGNCVMEKRLRKLRKGASRIALRAEARNHFKLHCRVLPVGLNYSNARNFRSRIFIEIGNPVPVNEYEKMYMDDKVKAVNHFTQRMEQELKALIVEVEHPESNRLFEELLEIYKPHLMMDQDLNLRNLKDEHLANCRIASAINYFHREHHSRFVHFKSQVLEYHSALGKLHLRDSMLAKENIDRATLPSMIKYLLLLGLGMPLHVAGLLFNYLPYRFAYRFAGKKVKQVHFLASVTFVIGLFGWLFYYIFQLLLIALISKSLLVTLAFGLFIPLSGLYSMHFYSRVKKALLHFRLFSLLRNHPAKAEHLIEQRHELFREMGIAKDLYCKNVGGSILG